MNKKANRSLNILLVLVMIISILSISAFAKAEAELPKVVRNLRTEVEYTTLFEAVSDAIDSDTLQLCAYSNSSGKRVTESNVLNIDKNLTIVLNGHHLSGQAPSGKIFNVAEGKKLVLIGGYKDDEENQVASEIDGSIDNHGEFFINGAMTFKDKISHKGRRLYIEGKHGDILISLDRDKYIEADANMTADSIKVYLLDTSLRTELNDRYHDCDDVLVCVGGNTTLEEVIITPEIDNPHVLLVHKTDGPKGEGLYLVDKIPSGIYLDGVNGDDSSDGSESGPVRTFAKAKKLLEKQIEDVDASYAGTYPDGIYVMDTVTVNGTESWSMPENTEMIRHEKLRSELVYVTGNLTITDMVITGMSEGGVTSESPLLDVHDGILTLGKGAILRNNTNTMVATLGSGNTAGGVRATSNAHIIIDGGTVTGNAAASGGGLGLYNNSVLTMNKGSITGNRALKRYNFNNCMPAGGGVIVAQSSKMYLNGGLISRNLSECLGGGISLGGYTTYTISTDKSNKGSLYMTAGIIDGNVASSSGGGIFVQANTEAVISAGSVTNNKALGSEDRNFGGGGICVNTDSNISYLDCGVLQLSGVLITDNKADIGGGGIGASSTSVTRIFSTEGAAIFQNKAPTARDVLFDSRKGEGTQILRNDRIAYLSRFMPGFGEAYWIQDGSDPYVEQEAINQLNRHTHITTRKSIELMSSPTKKDIQKAREAASVIISGNYSATRGGGIANGGDLIIGKQWNVDVQKKWADSGNVGNIRPDSVKIRLLAKVIVNEIETELPIEELDVTGEVILNTGNEWHYTWSNLPEVVPEDVSDLVPYKNSEIVYEVVEEEVPEGYSCFVDGNMIDGFVVTNTHTPKYIITYFVVNGTWEDGTSAPKTEEVVIGERPVKIPAGMKPAENYYGGQWDTDPGSKTITGNTSFIYTFKAEENPPLPVTVTGITLRSDSTRKVYTHGDTLDVTGLVLIVRKSDGSKETVNVMASMVTGFDSSKTGKQMLTVTYMGFTETYEIEFMERTNPTVIISTISYNLNGGMMDGKVGTVTIQAENGTTITLPAPTREGYTFDYWEGSRYDAGDSYTVNGDHTFMAQWKKNDNSNQNKTSPETGDKSNLAMHLMFMILSGAAMFVQLLYLRKRKTGK